MRGTFPQKALLSTGVSNCFQGGALLFSGSSREQFRNGFGGNFVQFAGYLQSELACATL
jgi:hypothetical protein